jgi:hypothetical protein
MFWGSTSIDIADVVEISFWAMMKPEFGDILTTKIGHVDFSYARLDLYFYYNTHRPEAWQLSRPGMALYDARSTAKSFVQVLDAARHLEATDSRDYIYAFLGCSFAKNEKGNMLVEADYTSSIYDLNVRLAYALMVDPTDGPFVLSFVRHDRRESLLDDACTSWAPKWHLVGKLGAPITGPDYWYRAGGSKEFFAIARSGENLLTVGGYTFDKVIWKSSTIQLDQTRMNLVYSNPTTPDTDKLFIDALWDELLGYAMKRGTLIRHEDFVRTLMQDYPASSARHLYPDEFQLELLEAYRKSMHVADIDDLGTVVLTAHERQLALYCEQKLRRLHNTSVFLTENGRIGLAPAGDLVETGDICCIIFGAQAPFLLTPAKEGRHKLVSDCYIHGVMDGEIMQHFTESDLSRHRIILA